LTSKSTEVPFASASGLQDYLHWHIPLSKAMQVRVVSIDDVCVVLESPLAPNINHQQTVFGGSASALAMLASWSLLQVRTRAEGIDARLVIRRNSMEYERPMVGAFMSRASFESLEQWRRFAQTFASRGKARITIAATLEEAGQVTGRFSGEFVALRWSVL
jgi:thioesterase domain-containing protein